MRALTSSACLEVWERGSRLHSLDRGLLALSVALPDVPPESLADWPLGQRNAALLELYCCCGFGPHLDAWTACERCGERMEMELDAREFLKERERDVAPASVLVGEHAFRLPSSRDLAAVAREKDPTLCLIARCRLSAGNAPVLSSAEVQRIEEAMAAADPLAEVQLALACPACSHAWVEALDVVSFLWAEIELRGRKLLGDVHTLASAYGWTEPDILSLGETRRGLYLEMVSATRAAGNVQAAPRGTLHSFPGIAR